MLAYFLWENNRGVQQALTWPEAGGFPLIWDWSRLLFTLWSGWLDPGRTRP
jgi:hypothetical protein